MAKEYSNKNLQKASFKNEDLRMQVSWIAIFAALISPMRILLAQILLTQGQELHR